MRATITMDAGNITRFDAKCQALLRNVEHGSKIAAEQACKEILAESMLQVPKDTRTLLASAYSEVRRRSDIAGYRYEAVVGYGGNGDPVNPKTGKRASEYMVKVHEDLSAWHLDGKAKFLEDPVRAYGSKFPRTVYECVGPAIAAAKGGM